MQVQVEVVEVLILQRAMFPKMKEVLHQEEEQGRALQALYDLLESFLCWVQVGQVWGSWGLNV